AVVLVAKVDCLARRVAYRVVRPWREVILLTVERPGMAAALDRTVEAEGTVADDVDPRRRCSLSCLQNRRVFPSAVGETAQPVEKLEGGTRRRRRERRGGTGRQAFRRRRGRLRLRHASNLVGQTAATGHEHRPSYGLEQISQFNRD